MAEEEWGTLTVHTEVLGLTRVSHRRVCGTE